MDKIYRCACTRIIYSGTCCRNTYKWAITVLPDGSHKVATRQAPSNGSSQHQQYSPEKPLDHVKCNYIINFMLSVALSRVARWSLSLAQNCSCVIYERIRIHFERQFIPTVQFSDMECCVCYPAVSYVSCY